MKLLLQAGADVNHVGKNGLTSLFIAFKYRNLQAVKLLLDLGANVYNKDTEVADSSPIFQVIQLKDPQFLQLILESRQGQTALKQQLIKDSRGFTPLQFAVS